MPGEFIGRFGPLSTYGGRTEGQPCTGLGDLCDDNDVEAWLQQAKHWSSLAKNVRQTVIKVFGNDPKFWPQKIQFGEVAYNQARNLLAGNQGWLDSSKVANAIEVQRLAKTSMELWFQGLEEKLDKKLEVNPQGLGYDGVGDPENTPPVINPKLIPDLGLPSFGTILLIAGGVFLAWNLLKEK